MGGAARGGASDRPTPQHPHTHHHMAVVEASVVCGSLVDEAFGDRGGRWLCCSALGNGSHSHHSQWVALLCSALTARNGTPLRGHHRRRTTGQSTHTWWSPSFAWHLVPHHTHTPPRRGTWWRRGRGAGVRHTGPGGMEGHGPFWVVEGAICALLHRCNTDDAEAQAAPRGPEAPLRRPDAFKAVPLCGSQDSAYHRTYRRQLRPSSQHGPRRPPRRECA